MIEESLPISGIEQTESKRGFSSATLKLIAIITMLIDHTGAAVFENTILPQALNSGDYQLYYTIDLILRSIGRLAFPIFCFLIVEGFYHTRNVTKYALRLAVFAIVSEVPFDLAIFHQPFYWGYQSVYLTLLIGLLVITGVDHFKKKIYVQILIAISGIALAFQLHTDYYGLGVLLILLLYLFREKEVWKIITSGCVFLLLGPIELLGLISFVPIHFYNGKKGMNINKYVFYAFYPVHLLLLYLISTYLL